MKSATWCSNWFYPVLWKKNMTRFWPIWAVYLVCWVFAMPLNLLSFYQDQDGAKYFAAEGVRQMAASPALLAASVFGILAAMAVFSYLYQAKSAGMLHALPVRREGLFLTNYLSGLSFMVLPQLAIFLLTLLCELAKGWVDMRALGIWLLSQVLHTLFFYSFAVFCAMFTGHILALPVFYGILNGLAAGLYYLIYNMLKSFVFGFAGSAAFSGVVEWLTPIMKLGMEVRVHYDPTGFTGMGFALLYALVGLVLAGLALVLYRRRKLEGAGDVVTVGWVRPIFKYGVSFCSALALGTFLYAYFGGGAFGNFGDNAWILLIFMLVCGAVGYFAAEMLLKKSFRVFRRGWKGLAVFTLCLIAATAALELDLTGFERRVPDPAQVSEVVVNGPSSAPTDSADYYYLRTADQETIRAVTELHSAIVARKDEYGQQRSWGRSGPMVTDDGLHLESVETETSAHIDVTYTLLTGATVQRTYRVPARSAELDQPGTPSYLLHALVNRPQDKVGTYFPSYLDQTRLVDVSVESVTIDENGSNTVEYVSIPTGQRQALLDAVKSDLAAGRIGARYLLDDLDRLENCYYNDLQFNFRIDDPPKDWRYSDDITITVTLQKTATETLALLEELRVLDHVNLMTRAEMQNAYWEIDYGQAGSEPDAVQAEVNRG